MRVRSGWTTPPATVDDLVVVSMHVISFWGWEEGSEVRPAGVAGTGCVWETLKVLFVASVKLLSETMLSRLPQIIHLI